jgi:hypothetical protein
MDIVVSDLHQEIALHVIMDNYCIHKKCDSWLSHHPNETFHFTPTSASWLNKVYNENADPFVWTKPEVKGSQLRNSAKNFHK